MFEPKKLHIRMTLTEEALGMAPANKEIYTKFIAANAPDAKSREQEIEENGIDEMVKQGTTVFPRMKDGTPFFWDYQIRGMFKDSMGMLRRVSGSKCSAAKNYKKLIDGLVFVEPRKIPIHLSGETSTCQRSLRTEGPSGSRTALAASETVPAGSTVECTILMMDASMEAYVRECLDYGIYRGLGQWRNSGKGTFTWEEIESVAEYTPEETIEGEATAEEPQEIAETTEAPEPIAESCEEVAGSCETQETAAETRETAAETQQPEETPEPIAEPEPEPAKAPEKKKRHRRTKAEIEAEKAAADEPNAEDEPSAETLEAIEEEAPKEKRPKNKDEFEMMLRQLMERYMNE